MFDIKVFSRMVLVFCASLVFLMGCAGATEKSRFYTLNSIRSLQAEAGDIGIKQGVVLGIGPIKIPERLDRPGIVTRSSLNRLEIAEFDRWGGSLQLRLLSARASADPLGFHGINN